MELFLNFLWALIAVVALGAWRACWWRQRRSERRDPLREWAAVTCALVLLFFAVSLSDDLRSSLALLDETAASRRFSPASWNAGHPSPDLLSQVPLLPASLTPRGALVAPFAKFVSVHISEQQACALIEGGLRLGRAPPDPFL